MDVAHLISQRSHTVMPSGIRRVSELKATLKDPIDLSLGQPSEPVPDPIKRAAVDAILADKNGYTVTRGIPELQRRIRRELHESHGWPTDESAYGVIVVAGTSAALVLAALATLNAGDECVLQDPYFVLYPPLAHMCGATPVFCDTYPDFRMTAARVEPLLTRRSKFVLCCSPSNPSGVTLSQREVDDLADLCVSRGVLLISDEIYDRFAFPEGAGHTPGAAGFGRAPSPCTARPGREPWNELLLVRGFGKTYGCTGWRMGYVAGPTALLTEMTKLNQYNFVCAPSMAQWGCLAAMDTNIDGIISTYARRRDTVVAALDGLCELPPPTGAFYAFPKVPERLGMTASEFCHAAYERSVLIVPGGVFSKRDTHFRLSYAAPDATLERGLGIIAEMMRR